LRLIRMRAARPDVFDSRELWLAVQRLFETLFFQLSTRRFVVRLFGSKARCKHAS